jgi:hypothetical protein
MNNKDQITYFLGAGASFNAIPVIDKLEEQIRTLKSYLIRLYNEYKLVNTNNKPINKKDALYEIIQELQWLILESKFHQTVDTLAKKYYLLEDRESLCRLKRAMIVYFFFEQNISFRANEDLHNFLLDKRYDNLIASIATRNKYGIHLKNHINIVTWNYDLQIDLAIKNYFPKNNHTLNFIKNENQVLPNKYSFKDNHVIDEGSFAVFKLNGNAFLDNTGFDNLHLDSETVNDFRFNNIRPTNLSIINSFLDEYSKIFSNSVNIDHEIYKYFNFAWEKNEEKYNSHLKIIKAAESIMQKTKILIIVGYSFPFFNSEIDSLLFSKCNPKEIVIQDPDANQIKERLLMLINKSNPTFENTKFKLLEPGKFFPIHSET